VNWSGRGIWRNTGSEERKKEQALEKTEQRCSPKVPAIVGHCHCRQADKQPQHFPKATNMNRRDKQPVCYHGPSFCDVALGLRLLHFQSLRGALKANEARAFFSH
jgi:hypothetical protein